MDAADRLALLDLQARLAFAIDAGEAEVWAACFAADGVMVTSTGLRLRGRRRLARFAAEWRASLNARPRHMTWNHLLRPDAGGATGCCYSSLLLEADGETRIAMTATYSDRFVRAPDERCGWLLAERRVSVE